MQFGVWQIPSCCLLLGVARSLLQQDILTVHHSRLCICRLMVRAIALQLMWLPTVMACTVAGDAQYCCLHAAATAPLSDALRVLALCKNAHMFGVSTQRHWSAVLLNARTCTHACRVACLCWHQWLVHFSQGVTKLLQLWVRSCPGGCVSRVITPGLMPVQTASMRLHELR
jgi:hypothetical protein